MQFCNVNDFIKWVESQKRFSKKTSLDKMKYLADLFDHPENKFKSIHITGTNGKGSTVAMLREVLMKNGLNVATYTSPYIICFNERIAYNKNFISDEDLLKFANMILSKYDIIERDNIELPTFFEFITILAFLYFSSLKDLDVAIIEVGMGGRLDATNIITPMLCAITNVALDHMQVLGNTKEEILIEKLGIAKPSIPIVTGLKDESLKNIAMEYTTKMNCLNVVPNCENIKINDATTNFSLFDYKGYKDIKLGLVGFHQIENATIVIELFDLLKDKYNLSISSLYDGLKDVKWEGRFEKISDYPYVIIDGCHNIDGISRICEFVSNFKFKKKRAIVSISHDKEIKKMIEILDDTFDEIVFTKYTYSRSIDANALYNLSHAKSKIIIDTISDAYDYALKNVYDLTVFMGSLYLVSEIKGLLRNNK